MRNPRRSKSIGSGSADTVSVSVLIKVQPYARR
jgi:hypothetical protein